MKDPLALRDEVLALVNATLRSPAETDPALREAVARRSTEHAGLAEPTATLPETLEGYVEKVARFAYKTTDEDIAALRASGYSEDQILEVTLSAALGASLARLERGLELLRE